jgi:predicted nucleic acid-binding protein
MITIGYLLDTVLVSETVKRAPDPNVAAWVEAHDESTFFVSVATLGEIQRGISKLHDSKRKEALLSWLARDVPQRFEGRILPVDTAVALTWGLLQGEAQRGGNGLPIVDCLIAATASVHNLTVVTRNARDMQRCGVPVLNPWQAPAS